MASAYGMAYAVRKREPLMTERNNMFTKDITSRKDNRVLLGVADVALAVIAVLVFPILAWPPSGLDWRSALVLALVALFFTAHFAASPSVPVTTQTRPAVSSENGSPEDTPADAVHG